jgi:hypothetical protein
MTLLWVWLYGLKFPLGIICAVGIIACFLNFFSARASGKGEANLATTVHIGLGIALFWVAIYAIPAPDYTKQIVYRNRVVEKPVVKRYIAQKQVLTRTIRVRDTQDARFHMCLDQKSTPYTQDELNSCMNFSKEYDQPRVVVQKVNVPYYAGIKTVMYTRDARVRWCMDKVGDLKQCLDFAMKMEAGPQVQVKYVHDSYQEIFDKCNSTGTIPASDPNGTAIRNDRIKTCGQLALQASHDH